jgi:hypothetical protein
LRDADPATEARFLDLRYDDIVADPMAQIRKVYARIGKELTPDDEANMQKWLGLNARESRPTHRYALGEFGLSENGLKEAFAFYRERMLF